MVSEQSMRLALADAGCELADLAFVCPHGSGTPKGDRSELYSIQALAAGAASPIPVCALKAYTAHLGGVSDMAEIILGIQALENRLVPGTLNFVETDAEFHHLSISSNHESTQKSRFLSTSYGILGQSSSVVVEVP